VVGENLTIEIPMNERRDNGRFSDSWFANNQEDGGTLLRTPFVNLLEEPFSPDETFDLLY
jgi:hypothetical protein